MAEVGVAGCYRGSRGEFARPQRWAIFEVFNKNNACLCNMHISTKIVKLQQYQLKAFEKQSKRTKLDK